VKVNMVKLAGGIFSPADEEAEAQLQKIKNCDHYTVDIKLNHNYKLLQKVHVFAKYCAQFYYGDIDVDKDQVELVRKKLLIFAGYHKQVFLADGIRFELTALSMSYDKMTPEDRNTCYNKLVDAALIHVFKSADEKIFNQLMSFF
jgi:hypothetical protein